jgi:hypothetical protein
MMESTRQEDQSQPDREVELGQAREELDRAIRRYAELSNCSPQRVVVALFEANTNRAQRRSRRHRSAAIGKQN